jgi:phosphinothricin acetyltransferase
VYAHRAQERAAFQWNAELSIYLDKNYQAKGIGKVLYEMMFELLSKQGIKTLYGLVTTPNPKSVKLHEKTGFQLAGTYRNTGFKANQWCDLLLYEKKIGEYDVKPAPMIPFSKMDRNELVAIIKKYEKMVQQ